MIGNLLEYFSFFSLFKVFVYSLKFFSIIVSLYPRIYVFVHNFKCLFMILGGQITKKSEQKPKKVDIIKNGGYIKLGWPNLHLTG